MPSQSGNAEATLEPAVPELVDDGDPVQGRHLVELADAGQLVELVARDRGRAPPDEHAEAGAEQRQPDDCADIVRLEPDGRGSSCREQAAGHDVPRIAIVSESDASAANVSA